MLWTYTGWQCIIPVPQAVDAGEGRVLITGAYGAGSVMLKVDKKGDSYAVSGLFKNPTLARIRSRRCSTTATTPTTRSTSAATASSR